MTRSPSVQHAGAGAGATNPGAPRLARDLPRPAERASESGVSLRHQNGTAAGPRSVPQPRRSVQLRDSAAQPAPPWSACNVLGLLIWILDRCPILESGLQKNPELSAVSRSKSGDPAAGLQGLSLQPLFLIHFARRWGCAVFPSLLARGKDADPPDEPALRRARPATNPDDSTSPRPQTRRRGSGRPSLRIPGNAASSQPSTDPPRPSSAAASLRRLDIAARATTATAGEKRTDRLCTRQRTRPT
jgi:hypothetical protein